MAFIVARRDVLTVSDRDLELKNGKSPFTIRETKVDSAEFLVDALFSLVWNYPPFEGVKNKSIDSL